MNGILPLWKEKGMTSHDCVFKLRKILGTKKVGHTGTLDPKRGGCFTYLYWPGDESGGVYNGHGKGICRDRFNWNSDRN